KSTLVHDILFHQLEARLSGGHSAKQHLGEPVGEVRALDGWEGIRDVVLVDQAPIGRTPRSNPVTYIKAFDELRALFAAAPLARARWHLQQVGLGYLRLGQPATTLSGGEAQRLKIARELALTKVRRGRKLYILDEPTTGLHLDDVRTLCRVLDRLVDAGHSVLVIEHHLDVIKRADWIVELGPGAGEAGGRVVAEGTPEAVAKVAESPTGRYLQDLA